MSGAGSLQRPRFAFPALVALGLGGAAELAPAPARAVVNAAGAVASEGAEATARPTTALSSPGDPPKGDEPARAPAPCRGFCYLHTFLEAGAGRGLRLNNPFRLQTPLGSTAESLSLTAPTMELRVAALSGEPFGWHHGAGLGASLALGGVPQQVLTPSYQIAHPLGSRAFWRAYAGPSLVTQPDFNVGFEVGSGCTGLLTAGVGLYIAVAYAQYWGAALDQTERTSIPILAAQVGTTLQYEVFP